MKILWAGDSWTIGGKLEEPEKTRFSKITSDYFSAEEVNISRNGIGNAEICLKTVDYLTKHEDIDFVVYSVGTMFSITVPNFNDDYLRKPFKTIAHYSTITNDAIFGKYLYTSSSNNKKSWYNLSSSRLILMDSYFSQLKIPYIFWIKDIDFYDYFSNDLDMPSNIKKNTITKSMRQVLNESKLPCHLESRHPLEEAHSFMAKTIFIPEIEKRL